MRVATALIALVVLLSVPGWPRGVGRAAETPADLTFRGPVSGGTISITCGSGIPADNPGGYSISVYQLGPA